MEGAKFWDGVCAELANRGTRDYSDGPHRVTRGDSCSLVPGDTQTCVALHGYGGHKRVTATLKPICTVGNSAAA